LDCIADDCLPYTSLIYMRITRMQQVKNKRS
jgi:hypothetical protein